MSFLKSLSEDNYGLPEITLRTKLWASKITHLEDNHELSESLLEDNYGLPKSL